MSHIVMLIKYTNDYTCDVHFKSTINIPESLLLCLLPSDVDATRDPVLPFHPILSIVRTQTEDYNSGWELVKTQVYYLNRQKYRD